MTFKYLKIEITPPGRHMLRSDLCVPEHTVCGEISNRVRSDYETVDFAS